MRLLNVKTLKLSSFFENEVPAYAILSHTWGKEEVTFQDIQRLESPDVQSMYGTKKIRFICEQAARDRLDWAWVDTCCIDKSSSAELSESINSMYRWYSGAQVCYVFLEDVNLESVFPSARTYRNNHKQACYYPRKKEILESFPALIKHIHGLVIGSRSEGAINIDATKSTTAGLLATLHNSRWFERGWTLQELLAPKHVHFYDCGWRPLGTKREIIPLLVARTGIPAKVLADPDLIQCNCVSTRMRWIVGRETSRPEDKVYCLLGIFSIQLPLLYGEGLERAFYRLQHAIFAASDDETLFAWNSFDSSKGPLAKQPDDFTLDLILHQSTSHNDPPLLTSRGIEFIRDLYVDSWVTELRLPLNYRMPLNCRSLSGDDMFLRLDNSEFRFGEDRVRIFDRRWCEPHKQHQVKGWTCLGRHHIVIPEDRSAPTRKQSQVIEFRIRPEASSNHLAMPLVKIIPDDPCHDMLVKSKYTALPILTTSFEVRHKAHGLYTSLFKFRIEASRAGSTLAPRKMVLVAENGYLDSGTVQMYEEADTAPAADESGAEDEEFQACLEDVRDFLEFQRRRIEARYSNRDQTILPKFCIYPFKSENMSSMPITASAFEKKLQRSEQIATDTVTSRRRIRSAMRHSDVRHGLTPTSGDSEALCILRCVDFWVVAEMRSSCAVEMWCVPF